MCGDVMCGDVMCGDVMCGDVVCGDVVCGDVMCGDVMKFQVDTCIVGKFREATSKSLSGGQNICKAASILVLCSHTPFHKQYWVWLHETIA